MPLCIIRPRFWWSILASHPASAKLGWSESGAPPGGAPSGRATGKRYSLSIGRHPGRRAGLTLSPYAGDRKGLFASRVRVDLEPQLPSPNVIALVTTRPLCGLPAPYNGD